MTEGTLSAVGGALSAEPSSSAEGALPSSMSEGTLCAVGGALSAWPSSSTEAVVSSFMSEPTISPRAMVTVNTMATWTPWFPQ